jgi:CRP-like cAMP-binding protein/predicted MFS family arabinose efflux permease
MTDATATTSKAGSFRSALAIPDFRWMFTAHAISTIGTWAYTVGIAVFVWDATESAGWVAAVSLGRFLPSLFFSTYGGVIAERFERRRVMITVDLLCATWMTCLALVAIFDGPVVLAIVFAGMTTVTGTAFFPAEAAMTPQVVGEKDLAAANALNGMVSNLSIIVGPGIGAVLLALGPPQVTFLLNGASFIVGALCLSRVRTRSRATDVTEGGSAGVFKQMTVGFKALKESTTALVLVSFSLFTTFLYGADTVLYVILAEERLGTGARGFGWLLAALGVGGVIGGFIANKVSASKRLGLVITIAILVYGVPTFFMQWVTDPMVAYAIQGVRGVGTIIVDVLAITALQRSLKPELISRVFGVVITLMLAVISLGVYLAPVLLAWIGLDGTLTLFGLAVPALTVLLYPKTASIDRRAAERLAAIESRIAAIEPLGIVAAAPRAVIERLATIAVPTQAGEGEWILREGDPADAFYVITAGTVEVIARGERVIEEPIRILKTGDYFGEIGLIEGVPRTASIRAGRNVGLLKIAGPEFLEALNQAPPSTAFVDGARRRLRATHPSMEISSTAEGGG